MTGYCYFGIDGIEHEYRAYAGAKWDSEPTESDYLASYPTLDEAQAAVTAAKRGGHGFVWEPVSRRLWGNGATSQWQLRDTA